jgi:hypothetical protein
MLSPKQQNILKVVKNTAKSFDAETKKNLVTALKRNKHKQQNLQRNSEH